MIVGDNYVITDTTEPPVESVATLSTEDVGWMSDVLFRRFWTKVEFGWDCWIWTGAKTKGYGHISVNKVYLYAHRLAYEFLIGPIPSELVIDHLCQTPACVNPGHMEMVTRVENLRRGPHHQREKTHCKNGHAFDETNTVVLARGRGCRICMRDARLRYEARRKVPA